MMHPVPETRIKKQRWNNYDDAIKNKKIIIIIMIMIFRRKETWRDFFFRCWLN